MGLDRIAGVDLETLRARTLERATFRSAGGRVYFPATTPAAGRELWSTDGTAAGTRLEFDACVGTCSGAPALLASAAEATGRPLFFAATAPAGAQSLCDGTSRCPRSTFEHVRERQLGGRLAELLADSFGDTIE